MSSEPVSFPVVRTDAPYLTRFGRGLRWGLGICGAALTVTGLFAVGLHWTLLLFL
jgi:hypothetical protein